MEEKKEEIKANENKEIPQVDKIEVDGKTHKKESPITEINIGGKMCKLAFLKLNDLDLFEQKFGKLVDIDMTKMSMAQVKYWIFLSLKRGGADVTEKQIGEEIDGSPSDIGKMMNTTLTKEEPRPLV